MYLFCYSISGVIFILLFRTFALPPKMTRFPTVPRCTCWPNLDLLLFRLEFLDFDLSRFEFLSLSLPFVSRFRAESDHKVSLAFLLRISSTKTRSRMSLYFSFSFLVELLTANLIASQLFGKEAKTINAWISS